MYKTAGNRAAQAAYYKHKRNAEKYSIFFKIVLKKKMPLSIK